MAHSPASAQNATRQDVLDRVRAMPGVRLVLVASDVAKLGPLPTPGVIPDVEIKAPNYPILAREIVRQALLIAARDQLQWTTRDGTLSERIPSPDEKPAAQWVLATRFPYAGQAKLTLHRVEADADQRLSRAKIVDPSWYNWPALPVAINDTIVPDFPLANKSFNLSYAGNDL